jgi:hypothetical protein
MASNYLSPLKETYMAIIITNDLIRLGIAEYYDPVALINIRQNSTQFWMTNT